MENNIFLLGGLIWLMSVLAWALYHVYKHQKYRLNQFKRQSPYENKFHTNHDIHFYRNQPGYDVCSPEVKRCMDNNT
jgi:hypothetical protein